MDMTIGKFALAGGLGVETVRFYQRKGLLKTPKRLEVPGVTALRI
jgi:MerR family mercuric resistance operon transcriptional regulator